MMVEPFLDAHPGAEQQIILDMDATDDPIHGHQEGRFFHGYYDCYCYLPLYILLGLFAQASAFCAGRAPICAKPRTSAPGEPALVFRQSSPIPFSDRRAIR
jgi:hypothetical protein